MLQPEPLTHENIYLCLEMAIENICQVDLARGGGGGGGEGGGGGGGGGGNGGDGGDEGGDKGSDEGGDDGSGSGQVVGGGNDYILVAFPLFN